MRSLALALFAGCLALAGALPAAAQDVTSAMNEVQRNALKDGCWELYTNNAYRREQCMDGGHGWWRALEVGCNKRYSGNRSKLDRCVDTDRLSGYYPQNRGSYGQGWQNPGYQGNAYGDTELRQRALEYGCRLRNQHGQSAIDACIRGNSTTRSAYSDGCFRLYGNDTGTYNRCMDAYSGGNSYGGNATGGYSGGGFGASGGGNMSNLTDVQQNALKDGCWQRYNGNNSKLQPCLRAEAYWRDALRDGCWKRYNGVPDKLNRCLAY